MSNRPKLRFKEFNNDWEDKKIGDVFEFYNGKAHEQEIDENGEYIVVNSKFISTEGQVKKYTNKVICPLKKDDIVLVMSDVPNGKAISKCYLIEEDNKYSLNQRICCLRTKDVARFFIYQISRNKYFLKFDNGVSQTNLRKEDVLKCPMQVPCLAEQDKIAEFLSKVDEVIAEREAEVKDLEQKKKGLMQKLFSQQLRFTDSNNQPYPEWERRTVDDVFNFINGKAHEQDIDDNGKYIVVNSKFISSDGNVKKYTNKIICPLKKNDIVLVMSDVPNGKAMSKCYLIDKDDTYSLNQRICCLRTKEVAKFYIYQVSRNKYFLKFDNGVSQTNLRKEDVLRCPVYTPCLEEQEKIANVLSKLDELIAEKNALLSDWQQFKKGLLQQMFV